MLWPARRTLTAVREGMAASTGRVPRMPDWSGDAVRDRRSRGLGSQRRGRLDRVRRIGVHGRRLCSGTRYSVVADVLSQLVDDYQGRIRFGFAQFPGADSLCSDSTVTGCCAGPPIVPVALNNGAAVQAALKQMLPPAGSTPRPWRCNSRMPTSRGSATRWPKRYVLLATDGLPSCTLSGTLSVEPARRRQREAFPMPARMRLPRCRLWFRTR